MFQHHGSHDMVMMMAKSTAPRWRSIRSNSERLPGIQMGNAEAVLTVRPWSGIVGGEQLRCRDRRRTDGTPCLLLNGWEKPPDGQCTKSRVLLIKTKVGKAAVNIAVTLNKREANHHRFADGDENRDHDLQGGGDLHRRHRSRPTPAFVGWAPCRFARKPRLGRSHGQMERALHSALGRQHG